MGVYQEVRALQAWARKDKKRYRRAGDPLLAKREAVQSANDGTFCNPAPDKRDDPAACAQWATRWLANFSKGGGV